MGKVIFGVKLEPTTGPAVGELKKAKNRPLSGVWAAAPQRGAMKLGIVLVRVGVSLLLMELSS
jgi:hypothetical protein